MNVRNLGKKPEITVLKFIYSKSELYVCSKDLKKQMSFSISHLVVPTPILDQLPQDALVRPANFLEIDSRSPTEHPIRIEIA